MARTWRALFITGDDVPPPPPETEEKKRGFFSRLRENMSKSRQALGAELQDTMFESLDDEAFEHLEETLIYADVGAPTTAKIVERLEGEATSGDLQSGEDLTNRLRELLAETATLPGDTIPLTATPTVILGGTALMGGRGSVIGTTLAVLVLGVMANGMNLLGTDAFWQIFLSGVILLLAVLVDEQRNRARQR